jgi:hypothetical protein
MSKDLFQGGAVDILIPEVSVLEKIVRPLGVYLFLLIAFRVAGKRELGQMTPFDLHCPANHQQRPTERDDRE